MINNNDIYNNVFSHKEFMRREARLDKEGEIKINRKCDTGYNNPSFSFNEITYDKNKSKKSRKFSSFVIDYNKFRDKYGIIRSRVLKCPFKGLLFVLYDEDLRGYFVNKCNFLMKVNVDEFIKYSKNQECMVEVAYMIYIFNLAKKLYEEKKIDKKPEVITTELLKGNSSFGQFNKLFVIYYHKEIEELKRKGKDVLIAGIISSYIRYYVMQGYIGEYYKIILNECKNVRKKNGSYSSICGDVILEYSDDIFEDLDNGIKKKIINS